MLKFYFQSNVLELWSLFDFLMPGFLGRPLAMEALHRQVLPFLLRRLKEDVLQDLPPKIIQDYYCELSPLQVSLLLWPTIKVRHWVDV
ncbi:unnamed protein product [Pocillopora meandrina]|uniref:SNF2 N-terminal domain-containing protein n=1 Tax=Pocillopora meandrina TaxID=46732 RepID=A0AAU9X5M3_9CNID|nr:unnamed protein product [Pocillopora meandrina]